MITGKNKEQFEKWYRNQKYNIGLFSARGSSYEELGFYDHKFEMQIGVYLAYYDSIKISIEVKPIDDWSNWMFTIYGEDCSAPFFQLCNSRILDLNTRNEAYKEAFKKADELINK
jgi:hypothetical protein